MYMEVVLPATLGWVEKVRPVEGAGALARVLGSSPAWHWGAAANTGETALTCLPLTFCRAAQIQISHGLVVLAHSSGVEDSLI